MNQDLPPIGKVISMHGDGTNERFKDNDIFFAALTRTKTPSAVTDFTQPDNPLIFVNDAFVEMTGYSRDELMGKNCRLLQGPDTDKTVVEYIRLTIEEGNESRTDILNYKKDQTPFWSRLTITPVYDPDGNPAYFFSSQIDITEHRIAQHRLIQSQKMEAMGQLTGGIAHDFNNLLTVIQGFAEMLQMQLTKSPLDMKRMERSVNSIVTAASRGASLTAQLLAFSRKQNLMTSIIQLHDFVDGMTSIIKQTVGEGIQVDISHDTDQCDICIDKNQAAAAILNIVINARDAMNNQGNLKITTAPIVVDASVTMFGQLDYGHYVHLQIDDDGCGMDSETLKRTIEPFFSTKDEGKGTGLGMSMVYGFVKQSGGTMALQSELGLGTIVHILFKCVVKEETTSTIETISP